MEMKQTFSIVGSIMLICLEVQHARMLMVKPNFANFCLFLLPFNCAINKSQLEFNLMVCEEEEVHKSIVMLEMFKNYIEIVVVLISTRFHC